MTKKEAPFTSLKNCSGKSLADTKWNPELGLQPGG
jgi:hypothetical protein